MIAEKLKKARLEKGWTQKVLAEKIGKSISVISSWERSIRQPNEETMLILSQLLETNFSNAKEKQSSKKSLSSTTKKDNAKKTNAKKADSKQNKKQVSVKKTRATVKKDDAKQSKKQVNVKKTRATVKKEKSTKDKQKLSITTQQKPISTNTQDFQFLMENDCFWVDKSNFIKEIWDSKKQVILITRPRRFGKTLTMSMIEHFFSNQCKSSKKFFKNLEIWKDVAFRKLQGSFPVIKINFTEFNTMNKLEFNRSFCNCLKDIYKQHLYLLDSTILSSEDKLDFSSTLHILREKQITDEVIKAVRLLGQLLSIHYNKKVIIIVDEYDTPLHDAYLNGNWNDIIEYIQKLFLTTFKTNPYLERAILTGVTTVSQESLLSKFNNADIATVLIDKYTDAIGFTEEEVKKSLEIYGIGSDEILAEVKRHYNGFVFGDNTVIYNPWSISHFLDDNKNKPASQIQCKSYWINTSSNRLALSVIQNANSQVKRDFEDLLQGNPIRVRINEHIVYSKLKQDSNVVWNLLLEAGYLTKVPNQSYSSDKTVLLKFTNLEVKEAFFYMIQDRLSITLDENNDYRQFIKALLQDDVKRMNECLSNIMYTVFSSFDFHKNDDERYYHVFITGLIVSMQDMYIIHSNREGGYGRFDCVLLPKRADLSPCIFEFKASESNTKEELEKSAKFALEQIEERDYATYFQPYGIDKKTVRKYGFAFYNRNVLICK